MSSEKPRPDVMGTQPSRGSVEDLRTHPARPFVLAIRDLLERLDDLLVTSVLLRMADDVLLAGGVVHPLESLLDVDRAGHAPGLPRAPLRDAPIPSRSGRRDDRGAARRSGPAQGRGRPGAGCRDDRGGVGGVGAAAQGRRAGCPAPGPRPPRPPPTGPAGPPHRALRLRGPRGRRGGTTAGEAV